jgi:hypothetical protein
MSRIFEHGAPRDEYERNERFEQMRRGLIVAPNAAMRPPEPTWTPVCQPYVAPPVNWNTITYEPRGAPQPLPVVVEEHATAEFPWAFLFGFMATVGTYFFLAIRAATFLEWMWVPPGTAAMLGLLWLPIFAATVVSIRLLLWARKVALKIHARYTAG